jgi:aspartate-semialdehyde dehydrogenase
LAEFHIPTAAIIGAESLIGRDIRDVLGGLKPTPDVRLISGVPEGAKITRDDEGDPMILAPFDEDTFEESDVVFLAGTPESSLKAVELAGTDGPVLIDVTGALEDHPRARLRAPQIFAPKAALRETIHVIANPAAVALALVFQRMGAKFKIERSVIGVFEPASERGQSGLSELQSQTINLLSFKPLPKTVYDAQAAFNMLAGYGAESPHSVEEIENRIDRHLASLLSIQPRVPMPSLRVIQAPVFHGYTCSLWVEFEKAPGVQELEEAIASAHIEVRRASEEPPNNVGVAGESGLIAGGIRADRNDPRAYWLWLVTDNLRMSADTAVAVAKEYL